MHAIIEKLASKLGEGLQASSLSQGQYDVNVFHRAVVALESSDISFIKGLVSTGLRGSIFLDGNKLLNNYHQILTASREHLPLVIHTNARLVGSSQYSSGNNYSHIYALQQVGCFQFVATSLQEEIFLTLIAHRISELSLIPGMVISDYSASDTEGAIPADHLIRAYLGSPDDHIQCPTPAQEMIFGRERRRIPNWYSLDLPAMLGSGKNDKAISYESAASQKYFNAHLPELFKKAFKEFQEVFGVELAPVSSKGSSSEFAVVSIGNTVRDLMEKNSDNSGGSDKTDMISIRQLSPFPVSELTDHLKGKKSMTILENITSSEISRSPFYQNVLESIEPSRTKVYSGKYSSDLDAGSLDLAISHMVSGQSKLEYYLGLNFTQAAGEYPKHNILLQEVGKQYPDIGDASISSGRTQEKSSAIVQDDIPLAVRMYEDHGPGYTRLARFYDNTAFFYEHDEHDELVADPFAALPIVPAASAGFFNRTSGRTVIPVFHADKCTACGDCFVQCPHSAILPIAINVESLMKAGMEMASSKGIVIVKLTPVLKNLAKLAPKSVKETDVKTVLDFLPKAFENLTVQMKLEGDKLATLKKEFNAVLTEIGEMPVTIIDTFFNLPNAHHKGSGEIFSLAVNPTSCTGCGICADVCDEDALTMVSQDTEIVGVAKAQFKLWEQLPDTSGDTINRLIHDENYSSLAAIMLSRNYTMTMSGASDSEEDNAYKTLLHIVTAMTESVVQPKLVNQLKQIDELIAATSENIHKNLSKGLPKDDLDGLSKSLKQARGRKISMQDIVNQMPDQGGGKLFDAEVLQRKASLVEELKNLHWSLSEGPTAVGRARFGMLIAGASSMDWAKHYPANHFTNPTVIQWNGSAPEQTMGLFYGQLRYLLDNIKLMRRAQLESRDKYDPSVHDLEIAELGWDDLTHEEKQLVPPILLIAERDDLNELGWSSINRILADKYPVKVFLFDHIISSKINSVSTLAQAHAGMISSIALKNAFVFQGGIGNKDHLVDGLLEGLDKTYPALFNLYANKYEKHGVVNIDWTPYASLAVNSRTFPCLSYDPQGSNNFLRGAIRLEGNEQKKVDWVEEEMSILNSDPVKYNITWADWAFVQNEWNNEFAPLPDGSACVLMHEYLLLDNNARKNKLPAIMRAGENGIKYYSVSQKVVEMTEAVLSHWKTLQELAGVITEFPEKLREEITKTLHEQYERDVDELKKNYTVKIQEQEAIQTEQLRQQLKEKLVALSRMAQTKTKV
jgi:pyruvate/2-oxoacid:ferredoxin oxidoreductase alpha subunit/Pyruvate/2-oxoacid:ferredoxin oxidoreductase delta subunit